MHKIKSTEQVIRDYRKRRKVTLAYRVLFRAYFVAFACLWLVAKNYPVTSYIHTHLLTGSWAMYLPISLLTTAICLGLYGHRCPICDTAYERRWDRPTPQDEGYCSTCRRWFSLRDYLALTKTG